MIIETWRRHHNAVRRHSSLDYLTRKEVKAALGHSTQPGAVSRFHGSDGSQPVTRRFGEGQIIALSKEADAGAPAKDSCRCRGFSDASFDNWRTK